jgi:hypothetical protein
VLHAALGGPHRAPRATARTAGREPPRVRPPSPQYWIDMSYVRRPQITAPAEPPRAPGSPCPLRPRRPVVEPLPVVAEPGLEPDVGPGDEAVEGRALVVDHHRSGPARADPQAGDPRLSRVLQPDHAHPESSCRRVCDRLVRTAPPPSHAFGVDSSSRPRSSFGGCTRTRKPLGRRCRRRKSDPGDRGGRQHSFASAGEDNHRLIRRPARSAATASQNVARSTTSPVRATAGRMRDRGAPLALPHPPPQPQGWQNCGRAAR